MTEEYGQEGGGEGREWMQLCYWSFKICNFKCVINATLTENAIFKAALYEAYSESKYRFAVKKIDQGFV